jgi:hypothetical protein
MVGRLVIVTVPAATPRKPNASVRQDQTFGPPGPSSKNELLPDN